MRTHNLNRDGRLCRAIGLAGSTRSVVGEMGGAIGLQVADAIVVKKGGTIASCKIGQ